MAIINTYYDYELQSECYKLTGERAYVHTTDTLLKLIEVTESTMNYCTAIFSVNVVGDKSNSNIIFYNNNTIQPFYNVTYNGSTYTVGNSENQMLNWSINDNSEKYVAFRLNYDTENNIIAKYKGNNKCLGSKSKINSVLVDKPLTATTMINLTLANSSVLHGDSISLTVDLTRTSDSINPNAHKGQTIKFYEGDTFLKSVKASASNTGFTTSFELPNGLHTLTAVFEGNDYLFHSEASIDVSVGYNVDVTYDNLWIDGIGAITATVTDYFNNLIDDCSVECTLNQNNILTGVTENGVVTLTNNNQQIEINNTIFVETENGDVSDSFSINRAYISEYSINTDDSVCADGYTVPLTIFATATDLGGNPVSLENAKINIPSCNPSTVYLNNNGSAVTNYTGTGAGDVTISANLNNLHNATVIVEDLLQYWKSNKNSLNKEYRVIQGKCLELTNGFKMEIANQEGRVIIALGSNTANYNFDYQYEFDVVSADNTYIGMGEYNTSFTSFFMQKISLKQGNHVVFKRYNGITSLIVDDEVLKSVSNVTNKPAFYVDRYISGSLGQANGYLTLDNLKFKRL